MLKQDRYDTVETVRKAVLEEMGNAKMKVCWKEGFRIRVHAENGLVTVSANREGLLSLAAQLTTLAEETPGSHIHYDVYNALEDNSDELILERVE